MDRRKEKELRDALQKERATEESNAKVYDERAKEVFASLWARLIPHITAVETHYTDFPVDLSGEVYPVVARVVRLFNVYNLRLFEDDSVPVSGEAFVFILRNFVWRKIS